MITDAVMITSVKQKLVSIVIVAFADVEIINDGKEKILVDAFEKIFINKKKLNIIYIFLFLFN